MLILQGDKAKTKGPLLPISIKGQNNSTINHCQSLSTKSIHQYPFINQKYIFYKKNGVSFSDMYMDKFSSRWEIISRKPWAKSNHLPNISMVEKTNGTASSEKHRQYIVISELWCFSNFKRVASKCKLVKFEISNNECKIKIVNKVKVQAMNVERK